MSEQNSGTSSPQGAVGGEVLEAGRELDELIAVRVMGLRFTTFPDGVLPKVKHWHRENGRPGSMSCPRYSTDISAAWEVVEAFETGRVVGDIPGWPHSHGWYVALTRSTGWAPHGGWEVFIGATESATAPTAPLAICRAALKATAPLHEQPQE